MNMIRNELTKRELIANGNTLLFDDQNVQIFMTGNGSPWEVSGKKYYDVEMIVINNTEYDINIDFDKLSINGWDAPSGLIVQISSGKKKKDTISLSLTAASLQNYKEIEDVEAVINIRIKGDVIFSSAPITIHFDW